ncbi:hypothetical protein GCM10010520_50750 [Rhizobium viscosum]|uniref:Uncharacterized protein n=1 Tax=Rhizobium viscosum TaxID=1673 RepID=A0ABR9IZF7_RHIVS|nr:hypothetical protein [Rhizobium viscosum]MBE1508603.1 hypothetical protein [Rhizobium viscosum]
MVEIRFSGNKQTVGVFPAHEQCKWGDDPVRGERTRITYAQKFNDQYKKFKAGEAQAAHGTPLEELTFLTQGKRLELKALNIYTVEALAALDGNNLRMLDMGGRELKTQAQFYLDSAARNHDAGSLAAEVASLRKQLSDLQQGKPAATKKGGKKAVEPKPEQEVEDEPENDADDAGGEVDPDNPFADWEPEDIANWIRDANPEFDIDGRWGKDTLAEKAKELNDKIAAAKAKGWSMTILSACQSAAVRLVGHKPTTIFSSQKKLELQLADLVQEAAVDIAKAFEWQALMVLAEHQGDGSKIAFDFPAGFDRMPVKGNIHSATWQQSGYRPARDRDPGFTCRPISLPARPVGGSCSMTRCRSTRRWAASRAIASTLSLARKPNSPAH